MPIYDAPQPAAIDPVDALLEGELPSAPTSAASQNFGSGADTPPLTTVPVSDASATEVPASPVESVPKIP